MEALIPFLFAAGMVTDLIIFTFLLRLHQRIPDVVKQARRQDRKARRLREDRERMVAVLAHELRTPTAVLVGYINLLTEGTLGDIPKMQRGALEAMQRAVTRLQVMEESAIETIKPPNFEVFDLVAMVGALIHDSDIIFSGTRRERGDVTITVRAPKRLPLEADQSKIRAAVFELINNAIKYCDKNVLVEIETNGEAIITVSDDGPGIPPADKKHIFDLFYQVDNSDTRPHEGTGFGLYVVSLMATMHNGSVEFDCNGGCSFRLVIPRNQL